MFISAIILGIIEGLTEFLPISSTGHLILANRWLSFEGHFAAVFDVVIQVGAVFAVVLYFRRELFPMSFALEERRRFISLWSRILAAFAPAVVIGLLLDDWIEAHLFHPLTVALALIVGAVWMFVVERSRRAPTVVDVRAIGWRQAVLVGFAQCLAMWPGFSRSAATILGGMTLGLSRTAAAEFSFFLAVPTLAGAAALKLMKEIIRLMREGVSLGVDEWLAIGVGTLVSFLVAYFVIAFFMRYIRTRSLVPFAVYRIALGLLILGVLARQSL